MRRYFILSLCCLSLWSCSGGSDAHKAKRAKTVPAKGGIRYKGKPLDGAIIVLAPTTADGTAASVMSDKDGKFELLSYPPDPGAVPGTYAVSVVKLAPAAAVPYSESSHDAPMPKTPAKPSVLVPEKFGNPGTSGLSLVIPEDGSESLFIDIKD